MKKTVYILIFCSSLFGVRGQRSIEKNTQITRVPLAEKFNLPARNFPKLLIKAFCEGKIGAFYPLKPELACGYHEFAAHFAMNNVQPTPKPEECETVSCPPAFCLCADESALPFTLYYDIIEEKEESNVTSSTGYKMKFIRLIYVLKKHDLEVFMFGPLFTYEEVIALAGTEYSLMNPKNDAANVSFKHYLESRIFSGYVLGAGNKPPVNPNREHDQWQH
jgi:hypothetical protein